MSTSVGQGRAEVSDMKGFLVGVGTFPVSRMEEQAWEEGMREARAGEVVFRFSCKWELQF